MAAGDGGGRGLGVASRAAAGQRRVAHLLERPHLEGAIAKEVPAAQCDPCLATEGRAERAACVRAR